MATCYYNKNKNEVGIKRFFNLLGKYLVYINIKVVFFTRSKVKSLDKNYFRFCFSGSKAHFFTNLGENDQTIPFDLKC